MGALHYTTPVTSAFDSNLFQMVTCRHFDQKTNRAHYIDYHRIIFRGRRFLNTEMGNIGRETDKPNSSQSPA
jgi:hypothetical protein